MANFVKFLHVGKMKYRQCLNLQHLIQKGIQNRTESDTVIVVEHEPVYTVGVREKLYSKEEELRLTELGADFFRVDRGGLITFHGPGQLVAYPILDLRNYNLNTRCYVKWLEDTIIDMCKQYSLNAYTTPYTGVWVSDMKICAIGIRVSHFVTTHGLALNCDVDLKWFSHIVPCGIREKTVTSLSQQLKSQVTVEEAVPKFKSSFAKVFSCELINVNDEETKALSKKLDFDV